MCNGLSRLGFTNNFQTSYTFRVHAARIIESLKINQIRKKQINCDVLVNDFFFDFEMSDEEDWETENPIPTKWDDEEEDVKVINVHVGCLGCRIRSRCSRTQQRVSVNITLV